MNPIGYVASVLLALLLTALGVQTWRVHDIQTELATERLNRQTERAAATAAGLAATEAARAEEQRRAAAIQEAAHAAEKQITQARADAVSAGNAADRLRQRATDLAARRCPAASNPAAPGVSASAPDAGLVLADLLSSTVEVAGRLAALADERGAAGNACSQAYDALRP